jgi:hypothetical protein
MGEVYRARDTKLGRDVALKVLPGAFTSDPDRLGRFERGAKVLASLNHPNIGHIYGLEEADGRKTLVLELVEGPTLADRVAPGPIAIEALAIAKAHGVGRRRVMLAARPPSGSRSTRRMLQEPDRAQKEACVLGHASAQPCRRAASGIRTALRASQRHARARPRRIRSPIDIGQ